MNNRVTNAQDEAFEILGPLRGFFKKFGNQGPTYSLTSCLQPILSQIDAHEVCLDREDVESCLRACCSYAERKKRLEPELAFSVDEIAALRFYSAEFDDDGGFYTVLNALLRDGARQKLKSFIEYIWLMMHAMSKCPLSPIATVYRGIKLPDEDKFLTVIKSYRAEKTFTWSQFSSCTHNLDVLDKDTFLGRTGWRIMFTITLTTNRARDISAFSMSDEKEVLLPANSRFEYIGLTTLSDSVVIIQLKEIEPEDPIYIFPSSSSALSFSSSSVAIQNNCPVHHVVEDLSFYCSSCEESVCAMCVWRHSGHSFTTLLEGASHARSKLMSNLGILNNSLSSLQLAYAKLTRFKEERLDLVAHICDDSELQIQRSLDLLKNAGNEVIESVKKQRDHSMIAFDEQICRIGEHVTILQESVSNSDSSNIAAIEQWKLLSAILIDIANAKYSTDVEAIIKSVPAVVMNTADVRKVLSPLCSVSSDYTVFELKDDDFKQQIQQLHSAQLAERSEHERVLRELVCVKQEQCRVIAKSLVALSALTTCPSGHILYQAIESVTSPSWACDGVCGKQAGSQMPRWHCAQCISNYDICFDCKPAIKINKAKIPVALGTEAHTSYYYCGRVLGRKAIPGSNGRCGVNNGPQCADCADMRK